MRSEVCVLSDASEILKHVLSDDKLRSSKLFQDMVFTDQPILRRGSQISRPETPPEIREMRSIAYTPEAYWKTSAWLFYTQGKFMENFSDVYDFSDDFVRYYPTYRDLTTEQLRGFFSWRTRIRSGETPPAPQPFIYMLAYEIINGIGVDEPVDGFHMLMKLRHDYGANDNAVKRYLSQWLTDYAVYYSIDPALIGDSPDIEFDRFLLTLINWEDCSDEDLWEAIFRLSSFPIAKSRFYESQKPPAASSADFPISSALNVNTPSWKNTSVSCPQITAGSLSPLSSTTADRSAPLTILSTPFTAIGALTVSGSAKCSAAPAEETKTSATLSVPWIPYSANAPVQAIKLNPVIPPGMLSLSLIRSSTRSSKKNA